jgi:hypothetical protein
MTASRSTRDNRRRKGVSKEKCTHEPGDDCSIELTGQHLDKYGCEITRVPDICCTIWKCMECDAELKACEDKRDDFEGSIASWVKGDKENV